MRLDIEEEALKWYGLGESETKIVSDVNEAFAFLLGGVPAERQVEIIDLYYGDALDHRLQ